MKFVKDLGWWFPDQEQHLVDWMRNPKGAMVLNDRPAYQGRKQQAVLGLVTNFRRAIDIGAHIGLWSYNLAPHFERVDAFEPVEAHRACFAKNVVSAAVTLHPMALGEKEGSVRMQTAASSSGDTMVAGAGDIPMNKLDDVLPDADDVGLMKLDCEGYELFVLRGAEQLIRRCMPVICVEQKRGHGRHFGLGDQDAVQYLEALGYKLAKEISGDFIMVPA